MNKTMLVLQYLESNRSITSWEAIEKFGATRLSRIIYDLRNRHNKEIISIPYDVIDRFGNKVRIAKYILKGDNK